jgi:hypothetical protein
LRYHRTTGLVPSQMQELACRVMSALKEPWNKKVGRPKSCGLYKAVGIACMYLRQNATEEFIGDLNDISQSTVSRIVTGIVPIVKSVLEEFVPGAQEAIEMVKGKVVLVDGTLTPTWSYEEHPELWNKKHKATGFNVQLISLLDGTAVWISSPLPGKRHDARAYKETGAKDIVKESGGGFGDKGYQGTGLVTPKKKPKGGELTMSDKEYNSQISSFRAPAERVFAHFKNWKVFHTDYRRPYSTYHDAFDAARALFFFSITWGFE